MGTLVSFHAHPDDETLACGGVMAMAAAAGHRVVVVAATRGERGEVAPGVLADGEALATRREGELRAAAAILGAQRVEILGYVDSGMAGTTGNDDPLSFWRADVDEAAGRLATVLRDERADVLTVYDPNGGYGHPDHVQVHRVGVRAADLAGTRVVYEAAMPRGELRAVVEHAGRAGVDLGVDPDEMLTRWGVPDEQVTTVVDVHPVLHLKRQAMRAHATQIAEESMFLASPLDLFELAFGREWFIKRGAPAGTRETWLDGLG